MIGSEAAGEASAVARFTVERNAMEFVAAAPRMHFDLATASSITSFCLGNSKGYIVATRGNPSPGESRVVSTDQTEGKFPVPLENKVGLADAVAGSVHF